jgi:hypothetical protein
MYIAACAPAPSGIAALRPAEIEDRVEGDRGAQRGGPSGAAPEKPRIRCGRRSAGSATPRRSTSARPGPASAASRLPGRGGGSGAAHRSVGVARDQRRPGREGDGDRPIVGAEPLAQEVAHRRRCCPGPRRRRRRLSAHTSSLPCGPSCASAHSTLRARANSPASNSQLSLMRRAWATSSACWRARAQASGVAGGDQGGAALVEVGEHRLDRRTVALGGELRPGLRDIRGSTSAR